MKNSHLESKKEAVTLDQIASLESKIELINQQIEMLVSEKAINHVIKEEDCESSPKTDRA